MKTTKNKINHRLIHGVDVVDISRAEFTETKLATKLLHSNELKIFKTLDTIQQIRFLAVHWAIKEALYKALGGNINYTDIELYKQEQVYCFDHPSYEIVISVSYVTPYILASVAGIKKSK